jgi:hypothetical protein
MPNSDQQVSLSVQNGSYQYSGGNKGNGNVENKVGQGPSKIHISLNAASNYFIKDVLLQGSGVQYFSFNINGNERKVTIDDDCTGPADVKYTVVVGDNNGGADVMCDPRIVNN